MTVEATPGQGAMKSIYIDRNVVSYMFNAEAPSPQVMASKCLLPLLTEFGRDSYRCPYSIAHFEEIHAGGEQYAPRDIQALALLTDDWFISESMKTDEVVLERRPAGPHYQMWALQKTDPNAMIAMVRRELENVTAPALKGLISEYFGLVDNIRSENTAMQMQFDQIFESLQSKAKGVFDAQAKLAPDADLAGVLHDLGNTIVSLNGEEITKVNRRIRNHTHKNKSFSLPNVPESALDLEGDRFRATVDKALKRSQYPFKSASEFFAFLPHKDVFPPFKTKVMQLSALSDFVRTTIEKKETKWTSITNDLSHLFLALRCDIFVSSDRIVRNRARFIKRWLDLPVLILNPEECVRHILRDLLHSVDPENSDREVMFEFKDAHGRPLGNFKVAV